MSLITDENTNEKEEWYYENGLSHYLQEAMGDAERIPEEPFLGSFASERETVIGRSLGCLKVMM